MKKFLLACALALPVLALANHRASAWCNFNLSAGVNISWQHGWNRSCCGAACPDAGYPTDGHYPAYDGHYGGYTVPADATPAPAPDKTFPPAPKTADDVKKSGYFGAWGNGYQPVGYTSYGYQAGQYAYPYGGYYQYPTSGYFQAPSYWYGR
jgi:hypothetical protein